MIVSLIVGVLTGAIQAGTSVLYAALGDVRIPDGETGGIELLDTTDWLVEGVVGQTE